MTRLHLSSIIQLILKLLRIVKRLLINFLHYVIDDPDSFHNAQLQTYYMAQVASGLRNKTNFFIAKSGVRTGKRPKAYRFIRIV